MIASFEKKVLFFKYPIGTSRGVLTEKHSWILSIYKNRSIGVGECSIISGLSPDYLNDEVYEAFLSRVCQNIEYYIHNLIELKPYPSILFGLESALLDLNNGGKRLYFDNSFSQGKRHIPINGSVWMGDSSFMLNQISEKIKQGFDCIKMKVGAINFKKECEILRKIRKEFPPGKIELRLDANGAFSSSEALEKLNTLEEFNVHSIEQPIMKGQIKSMALLCEKSIIPIALDEELIGIQDLKSKKELLNSIRPQYIILKPSLHGGISGTKEWIEVSEKAGIPWWMTSALESNVGLLTIAQFVGEYSNKLPQGLGTGSLYTNNYPTRLEILNGFISQNNNK